MTEEAKTRKRKRSQDGFTSSPPSSVEWKSEHITLSMDDDVDEFCGADHDGFPCPEPKANAVYNSSSRVMQCPTCGCEVRRPIVDGNFEFLDSAGGVVTILPGATHNLDDEDRRQEAINDGLVMGHGYQPSEAVIMAIAPPRDDETIVIDTLVRRLSLPSVVNGMAKTMWYELKENKHFERVPKRKETQVALLMVACKRNGTPRPLHLFLAEAGVKQDVVKAAMHSMATREVPLTYLRLTAIQGFVNYFLRLHFHRDASTDPTSSEFQLVSKAHEWCQYYVTTCEAEDGKEQAVDECEDEDAPKKGSKRKLETTVAATSIVAAYMNDAKLNAVYHKTLALSSFAKLTNVSAKAIHACLKDLADSRPKGGFKSYEKSAATPKKKTSLLGRRTMKGTVVAEAV